MFWSESSFRSIDYVRHQTAYRQAHVAGRRPWRHGLSCRPDRRSRERQEVTDQTKEILARIERLLAEAGSDKTKILSATIYLADIATFEEMNAVWDAWVASGHAPGRATVEAKLAAPVYTVEIVCIAARS